MSPQIKYAYKTHNTWVYRRTYPKALQPLLGSALKQSLKTGDATQAKLRVAELNQTFTTIIKEAQAHALATSLTPILPLLPKVLDWLWLALDISVLVLWVSGW
jgi:hypothetical protein